MGDGVWGVVGSGSRGGVFTLERGDAGVRVCWGGGGGGGCAGDRPALTAGGGDLRSRLGSRLPRFGGGRRRRDCRQRRRRDRQRRGRPLAGSNVTGVADPPTAGPPACCCWAGAAAGYMAPRLGIFARFVALRLVWRGALRVLEPFCRDAVRRGRPQ